MTHGPPRPTTVDVQFVDKDAGMAAAAECRAAGFPIDIAADGGIRLTVRATTDRLDELAAIVDTHGGEWQGPEAATGTETATP